MDLSRKKGKRVSKDVGIGNASYQNLLNKYLELQKECVSMKKKRRTALLKRDKLLGEVRFLRQRRKALLKFQAPIVDQRNASSHLELNCSSAGKQGIQIVEALHSQSVALKNGKKAKIHQHGIRKQSKCWNGEEATLKV